MSVRRKNHMSTFQRERRLMQSKHLWDMFSIDWYKLQGDDARNVYNKWYADQRYMYAYKSTKTLRGIEWSVVHIAGGHTLISSRVYERVDVHVKAALIRGPHHNCTLALEIFVRQAQ